MSYENNGLKIAELDAQTGGVPMCPKDTLFKGHIVQRTHSALLQVKVDPALCLRTTNA